MSTGASMADGKHPPAKHPFDKRGIWAAAFGLSFVLFHAALLWGAVRWQAWVVAASVFAVVYAAGTHLRRKAEAEPATVTEHSEPLRRQRSRSLAIAFALGILVLIFYAATIVRLGPNALRRDDFDRAPDPAASQQAPAPAAPDAADCKKAGTC